MKQGRSLKELAEELDRQVETRKDYLAPSQKLRAVVDDGTVKLAGINGDAYSINPYAHAQIADDLAIPKKYYDRMATEAPALLATNVNAWLVQTPTKRLVRTLDGRVRGWLSDRYRPLDNFDLLQAVLPALHDLGEGVKVESAELTETKMYIKILMPSLSMDIAQARREAMVKAGIALHAERPSHVVQAGLTISNSELGAGALRIDESLYELVCYNWAIIQRSLRKYHVGRRHGGNGDDGFDESVRALLSDEARAADDKAFFLKARDVVKGALTAARFEGNVMKFAATAGEPIVKPIEDVIEAVSVKFGMSDGVRKNVLQHLAEEGDLSKFGLIRAVTRSAQDVESYDEATALEEAGGKILELGRDEWKVLAGK